jgi:hypothetical protein
MVLERPAPVEPPRAAIGLAALPKLPSLPRIAAPEGLRAAGEDLRWTARAVIANTVGLVPRGS